VDGRASSALARFFGELGERNVEGAGRTRITASTGGRSQHPGADDLAEPPLEAIPLGAECRPGDDGEGERESGLRGLIAVDQRHSRMDSRPPGVSDRTCPGPSTLSSVLRATRIVALRHCTGWGDELAMGFPGSRSRLFSLRTLDRASRYWFGRQFESASQSSPCLRLGKSSGLRGCWRMATRAG
jgi:hypothetical protein